MSDKPKSAMIQAYQRTVAQLESLVGQEIGDPPRRPMTRIQALEWIVDDWFNSHPDVKPLAEVAK